MTSSSLLVGQGIVFDANDNGLLRVFAPKKVDGAERRCTLRFPGAVFGVGVGYELSDKGMLRQSRHSGFLSLGLINTKT